MSTPMSVKALSVFKISVAFASNLCCTGKVAKARYFPVSSDAGTAD